MERREQLLNAMLKTNTQQKRKVEKQKFITREMIRNNPQKLFLYGDNLEQKGYNGQAKEMRGEPNTIGIPTKNKPTMEKDAFLTDNDYNYIKRIIDEKIKKALS